jgi:type 1 glutamine amidotransferase
MARSRLRRILGYVAAAGLVVVLVVGYQAWKRIAPVFGWIDPVVDTIAPELPAGLAEAPLAILLFSKTSGFRHDAAISAARASLEEIAGEHGWAVFATENAAVFDDDHLADFDVVFGNNITGDNWTPQQKEAFVRFIEAGGGFVGVHGAAGTRYRYWDWYTDDLLGGGRFIGHPTTPQFRNARVEIEDRTHPITRHFGASFEHVDEWYSFEASPREAGSHVLATLDEASYEPGDSWSMGNDHPIIWIACPGKGRSFYSGLGHTAPTYERSDHRKLLEAAIAWAADREGSCP